jgi:hypothetical protein
MPLSSNQQDLYATNQPDDFDGLVQVLGRGQQACQSLAVYYTSLVQT